jgi:hypothetical protein
MQRIGVLTGRAQGFNLAALRFIVLQLNRLQQSFEYEFFRTDDFDHPLLTALCDDVTVERNDVKAQIPSFLRAYTFHLTDKNAELSLLEPPPDYFVLFSLARYADGFYSTRRGRMSVLALGNWDDWMAPPSIIEFALTLLARESVAAVSPSLRGSIHAGTKGCLCDFTEYVDETRFKALSPILCKFCRDALTKDGVGGIAADLLRILDKEWLGRRSDPGSPAGIMSKLGYDLFLTKGRQASWREKFVETIQREGTKELLRLIAEVAIVGLLLWLGLKKN